MRRYTEIDVNEICCEIVGWIHLARDRVQLKAPVTTIMNTRQDMFWQADRLPDSQPELYPLQWVTQLICLGTTRSKTHSEGEICSTPAIRQRYFKDVVWFQKYISEWQSCITYYIKVYFLCPFNCKEALHRICLYRCFHYGPTEKRATSDMQHGSSVLICLAGCRESVKRYSNPKLKSIKRNE